MGIITGQNTITGWHFLFVVLLYTMARTSGDTRYACNNETYSSGSMCVDDSNLTYVCCDPDTVPTTMPTTETNQTTNYPGAPDDDPDDATFFEVFIPHVLWLTALIISNLITAGVIWAIWARRNANRPT